MKRQQRILDLRRRLAGRRLAWFGSRGADAQPLLVFEEFADCCSQIAPLGSISIRRETCLETIKRRRVDLEAYDIDLDRSEAVVVLQDHLLDVLRTPSVVVPYRPTRVLSSVCFLCSRTVEYLGQFSDAQVAFEHKHWVESGLREVGVPVVTWTYVSPRELDSLCDRLDGGPIVLRRARSSGGAGYEIVRQPEDLARASESMASEDVVSVASLLEPNIPLNVGACVFPDGATTAYTPSLQLIGLSACTSREFGYCGNDFAAVRDLDSVLLGKLDRIVQRAGAWLHTKGYRGGFGIDALVHDGEVFLLEINPRFQGSSAVSAQLSAAMDLPDIYLDHMAAHLGLPPSSRIALYDLAREQPEKAQIICHNVHPHPVRARPEPGHEDRGVLYTLVPDGSVQIDPEAVLVKLVTDRAVTGDGFHLSDWAAACAESARSRLYPDPTVGARKAAAVR